MWIINSFHNEEEEISMKGHKGELNTINNNVLQTSSRRQVLWGLKQRVQGSNGSNAAQLSCPQGSTLSFQLHVGVSCGIGLRHGVAMHPRGRHSREGMTLLPHGTYTHTAREQKPPQQPYYHITNSNPPYRNSQNNNLSSGLLFPTTLTILDFTNLYC